MLNFFWIEKIWIFGKTTKTKYFIIIKELMLQETWTHVTSCTSWRTWLALHLFSFEYLWNHITACFVIIKTSLGRSVAIITLTYILISRLEQTAHRRGKQWILFFHPAGATINYHSPGTSDYPFLGAEACGDKYQWVINQVCPAITEPTIVIRTLVFLKFYIMYGGNSMWYL